MNDQTILVVEDDEKIRTLLRRSLEMEGFEILEAEDEKSALEYVSSTPLALITLDLRLGESNGLDIARKIRKTSNVPIIMLTGADDVIDRILGLEIGADDYLTKPFHIRELIARIRSLLRRSRDAGTAADLAVTAEPSNDNAGGEQIELDGMTVYLDRFELRDREGSIRSLTGLEHKLLEVFLGNPKRVMKREVLMDRINGIEWAPLDRTIDNQVARLRKKIERNPAEPMLIKTIRGVGYVLSYDL